MDGRSGGGAVSALWDWEESPSANDVVVTGVSGDSAATPSAEADVTLGDAAACCHQDGQGAGGNTHTLDELKTHKGTQIIYSRTTYKALSATVHP